MAVTCKKWQASARTTSPLSNHILVRNLGFFDGCRASVAFYGIFTLPVTKMKSGILSISLYRVNHFEPIEVRHLNVQEYDIGGELPDLLDVLRARRPWRALLLQLRHGSVIVP